MVNSAGLPNGELGGVAEIDGTNDIRASFHHGHYSAN
jgi:hypothetical protein